MFLLLMPIFAAPWEALAAFSKITSLVKLTLVFMGAGIPMYYLTARARAKASGRGYSRVGEADVDNSNMRGTLGSESCISFD